MKFLYFIVNQKGSMAMHYFIYGTKKYIIYCSQWFPLVSGHGTQKVLTINLKSFSRGLSHIKINLLCTVLVELIFFLIVKIFVVDLKPSVVQDALFRGKHTVDVLLVFN